MLSVDVLKDLRALNRIAVERAHFAPHSREGCSLDIQSGQIRSRIPASVLTHHDRLAARGIPSVAGINGSNCGGCHLKLPSGLMADLAAPERFATCPHCGVFLWSGDRPAEEAVPRMAPAAIEKRRAPRTSVAAK